MATAPTAQPLRIYVRTHPVRRLGIVARGAAIAVAAAGFGVLIVAHRLSPDPRGVGTHEQLGMPACGFMAVTGLPCPSCGFTTSFSLFSHGRWLRSALNQPAGFALALAAATAAWLALYIALTGKPLHRLFARYVTPTTILQAGFLMLLAWAYKIARIKLGYS